MYCYVSGLKGTAAPGTWKYSLVFNRRKNWNGSRCLWLYRAWGKVFGDFFFRQWLFLVSASLKEFWFHAWPKKYVWCKFTWQFLADGFSQSAAKSFGCSETCLLAVPTREMILCQVGVCSAVPPASVCSCKVAPLKSASIQSGHLIRSLLGPRRQKDFFLEIGQKRDCLAFLKPASPEFVSQSIYPECSTDPN